MSDTTQPATLSLVDTTIGKKAVVAITGAVLFGFVIAHMVGNLQVFLGREVFNGYAAFLKSMPSVLWGARAVLLVSVIAHVVMTFQLVSHARQARPVGYRLKQSAAATYASRSMKYTGPLLAVFILYHLAHFTFPGLAMGGYTHDPVDVYSNVIHGFQIPWVTALYLVAQVLLGLHLHHGAWSLFQTVGLSHPRFDRLRNTVPKAIAFGVVAGNLIIPTAVLAGVVK